MGVIVIMCCLFIGVAIYADMEQSNAIWKQKAVEDYIADVRKRCLADVKRWLK